jgi:hypothetical protein
MTLRFALDLRQAMELAKGRTPFEGQKPLKVLKSILRCDPPQLTGDFTQPFKVACPAEPPPRALRPFARPSPPNPVVVPPVDVGRCRLRARRTLCGCAWRGTRRTGPLPRSCCGSGC